MTRWMDHRQRRSDCRPRPRAHGAGSGLSKCPLAAYAHCMSDDLDLEAGRLLFARPFVFVKGCVRIDDLPPPDRVEVAFAGRSNVGKSSLINALTGTRDLARTSNTPGRTQELNIFESADAPLRIVDMPGYGFA